MQWNQVFVLLACGVLLNPTPARAQDANRWLWTPVDQARCGNGSPTGYGWKQADQSRKLVIFFQGGGACRNYFECYVLHTAARLTQGYDAAHFAQQAQTLQESFFLTSPEGPFSKMHMAWVPYCTGDLHAGRQVLKEFDGRHTYHVGAINAAADMVHAGARVGPIEDVWLVGFSAGGFATVLNSASAKMVFPDARIHVIDDSGLAFADSSQVPQRWGSAAFPADCKGCGSNLSLMLPYLARANPDSRFAYVSYTRDTVLPLFFHRTQLDFRREAEAFADSLDLLQLPNLSYFYVPGRGHVVAENPDAEVDNIRWADWISELIAGADDWVSERAAPNIDDDLPEVSPANGTDSVLDPSHGLPETDEDEAP